MFPLSSHASWATAPSHTIYVNSASSFVSKMKFRKNVLRKPKKGLYHSKENTFASPSTSPCWLQPLSIFFPFSLSSPCQEEEKSIHVHEKWQNYRMLFCRFFSPTRLYKVLFTNILVSSEVIQKIMITFN